MKRATLGLATLSLALLVGCGQKQETSNTPIIPEKTGKEIVKVNGDVITDAMFNEMMETQFNSSMLADKMVDIKDPKNRLIYLVFKDRSINELIVKDLLDQEIEKRGITATQDEINQVIDQIAKNAGGRSKLESTLTLNNINKANFEKQVAHDIKMKKLISSLGRVVVSSNEVKKFYDENKKEKFTNPDMVKASHILIGASKEDIEMKVKNEDPTLSDADVQKKVQVELEQIKTDAQKILAEVKAKPEDFAKFAEKYSEDFQSAKVGGDLGFFQRKDMVREFSDAAFTLKPDTISNLVQSSFGYHIIKVTDRKKAGITPLAAVQGEIQKYLGEQKTMALAQKLVDSLKAQSKITYLDPEYDINKIETEIKVLANKQKQEMGGKMPVQKNVQ